MFSWGIELEHWFEMGQIFSETIYTKGNCGFMHNNSQKDGGNYGFMHNISQKDG